MIRVFHLFCKLNFKNISAIDFFTQSMAELKVQDHKCSTCGSKHPDWERHATYDRYLISFEKGHTVTYLIIIIRYKCSSCGHTHAILPECIIPYQSYSLFFILAVLRDYFGGTITVQNISEKYDISVTTLYAWKKLFLKQKKIWLGMLEDAYTLSSKFLNSFFTGNLIHNFREFFLTAGVSFLQRSIQSNKSYSVQVRSP